MRVRPYRTGDYREVMSFFGTVQGPWYTVGYLMVQNVEKSEGRPALLRLLCDPVALVTTYQDIARGRDPEDAQLPSGPSRLYEH